MVWSSNPTHGEVYSIQHYVIFLQYQNYLYIFFQSLIESLEGKAGKPRLKPPFPADIGVFGCACANEIIPSINRSFVYKAKEGRHVRMLDSLSISFLTNKDQV
jgi:hypothetical protein